MAATYEPIATTTLSTTTADVTFSTISGSFTDLIIVAIATSTSNAGIYLQFNNDTGSNYSRTNLEGDGSVAKSDRDTNQTGMPLGIAFTTEIPANIFHIMNYSNSTTYKTALARQNTTSAVTRAIVGLWRSTAAITTIRVYPTAGSFKSGSTFTLYGIASA